MKLKKIFEFAFSLFMPAAFLCLWSFIAWKINKPAQLPAPGVIVDNFANAFDNFIGLGSIPRNVAYSLTRVAIGYSIGVALALPLGLIMGYYKSARLFLENFLSIFKPIPAIAWQPIVLGWFGVLSVARMFNIPYGETYAIWDNFKISMIFLIAFGTFYPVWGNVVFGVTSVQKTLIESARVLGASTWDIFFHVLLPGCTPHIVSGLRMGLTSSWVCLVSAEMLPGSMCGIGYLITHAYEVSRMDLVITGMICIGFIGALLDGIFRLISTRCFTWASHIQ